MTTAIDPRYPIGRYRSEGALTPERRGELIAQIERTPNELRRAVKDLSPEQLDTPYRDGGWTVRQLVHHVPESHMNAYVRFKLALTEDEPTIKPYDEARWAELPDARSAPPELSLALLDSLHARWLILLRNMSPSDFARTLRHPEHPGVLTLDWMLGLYGWHGRHHVAHVTSLRQRKGW